MPDHQMLCKALEEPPHREMASEDIGWLVEENKFAEAIHHLITFFGYETLDTRLPEPQDPHLEG
jgi:hypothetical protein